MSAINHLKAKVGSLSQSRAADDPELVKARQDLKAEHLAKDVAAVVNSFPALRQDQLDHLARLLRPAGGDSA
ncbi:hypothetical protein [Arthrobacter sp. FW306-04-A]|uniref:hypothetical protein n=1 Tax=Arthrobacter sp. FW306-04-A TaxID=2879619 RepID=UPI0037BEA1C8|nr:hypothetical protein LFT43_12375 [Arthrobacter sp. FW306-04-A]